MLVWDTATPPLMQLDVYTCVPIKAIQVMEKLKEFDPILMHWKYLDRENDLRMLDIGIWSEHSPLPNKRILNDE